MLYTQKLLAQLEEKREQFSGYQDRYGKQLDAYVQALGSLGHRFTSVEAISTWQRAFRTSTDAGSGPSLGATPTAEYDAWRSQRPGSGPAVPVLPFGVSFANHSEARGWAERIRGITTFAVDGSQLLPWRDASIPVALVQAALFENPHQPPTPYVKDVVTDVLSPDELLHGVSDVVDARTGEEFGYSEQIVHLRRFELETRVLGDRMRHHAEREGADISRRVLAIYDGSLLLSFALKMPPPYRDRYVRAMRQLLATSRETRVPLVAYIDTSYARDILTMLRGLDDTGMLGEPRGLHDALLWNRHMQWGDRSPAFLSVRDDLTRAGYDDQQGEVAFVYFQSASSRPPARLEFPRWVHDEGLLDFVVEVVRAEAIAGNGYLYPIEAADAAAVISLQDRAAFYGIFQQFAEHEHLPFSFSRKALSKSRRR